MTLCISWYSDEINAFEDAQEAQALKPKTNGAKNKNKNVSITSLNGSKTTPPIHLPKETGRFDTNSSSEITQKFRSL